MICSKEKVLQATDGSDKTVPCHISTTKWTIEVSIHKVYLKGITAQHLSLASHFISHNLLTSPPVTNTVREVLKLCFLRSVQIALTPVTNHSGVHLQATQCCPFQVDRRALVYLHSWTTFKSTQMTHISGLNMTGLGFDCTKQGWRKRKLWRNNTLE